MTITAATVASFVSNSTRANHCAWTDDVNGGAEDLITSLTAGNTTITHAAIGGENPSLCIEDIIDIVTSSAEVAVIEVAGWSKSMEFFAEAMLDSKVARQPVKIGPSILFVMNNDVPKTHLGFSPYMMNRCTHYELAA